MAFWMYFRNAFFFTAYCIIQWGNGAPEKKFSGALFIVPPKERGG